ncbi:MAG: hypothetical protein AAF551_11090 [Bacteroidota bacterium]
MKGPLGPNEKLIKSEILRTGKDLESRMEEKKLELYYDHYKDTFQQLRKYLVQRDRLFFYSILVIFLMVLISHNLQAVTSISEGMVKSKFDLKSIKIEPHLVSTVTLFLFLSILIRYYQLNLLINRQYTYIHTLESKLSEALSNYPISRESQGYLHNYPFVLQLIHWVYTLVIPLLIIGVSLMKYVNELKIFKNNYGSIYFIANTTFTILIVTLSIMYLSWLHFKDFKTQNG